MALRVGVDVGGTFTDLVALDDASGELLRFKVPSVPVAPERGVLAAADALLAAVDGAAVTWLSHSTTIATNALLGQENLPLARVALLATEGFTDVIEIGRQNRSEVYDPAVVRPRPLVARDDRIGVRERMDAAGSAVVALDAGAIGEAVEAVRSRPGVEAVAVSLLHSYANPAHERALGDALAAALPGLDVSLSCDVDPAYREYERTSTTVVNAALRPLLRGYLLRLADGLRERGIAAPLYVMQSGGGAATAEAAARRPAAVIESGPASGVIGAAFVARSLGIPHALSFDMGGTTAKAGCVVDGAVQVTGEFEAAGRTHSGRAVRGSGYPVRFPFVDLAEVSAGGGTIAYVDEAGALRVGPLSAGADPGPACYGRSERPTVTDANVVLGRSNPHALLGGALPIDAARAHAAVATIARAIGAASVEEAAAGIVTLIDNAMAKTLRIVTVERGWDPRDFTLIAFGGGGPLHAASLAADLAIARVVVPPSPGLFSAYGLLVADVSASAARAVPLGRDADAGALAALFADAEDDVRLRVRAQGVAGGDVRVVLEADARYAGQSFELAVEARLPFDEAALAALREAFHRRHERTYGFAARGEAVEFVNVRATAIAVLSKPAPARAVPATSVEPRRRAVHVGGALVAGVAVYERGSLGAGAAFDGPAVVEEFDASTLVPPGWRAQVDAAANLVLER
jgi:N-methylhydantoinase A